MITTLSILKTINVSCSDTQILVKTKKNTISINGICLKIEYYCPEELKISGNILYINYE